MKRAEVLTPTVIDEPHDADPVLARLMRLMRDDAAQQSSVITEEAVTPKHGVVQRASSPDLMDKIALACCDLTHRVRDPTVAGGERDANIHERLQRVGVSTELYLQLCQSSEWRKLLDRRSDEIQVFPLLPRIKAALAARALTGDDKAARLLMEIAKIFNAREEDELRRQFAHYSEDAWLNELRGEYERIGAILSDYELKPLPETTCTIEPSPAAPSTSPDSTTTPTASAPSALPTP